MESISVVIPCYNQAPFLGEAIESVLAQTYPAHEIVVVDDSSQDHSAAVVTRYPNVRYIRQAHHGIVAVARNRGMNETSGRYLVFLDGDDRLLPHHLETSLRAFKERPPPAAVCGLFRAFGDDEWITRHTCNPADSYGTVLRFPSIAMILTTMIRRSVLVESGGFSTDRTINGCDDFELFLRVTQRHPLHCHHQLVAEHRLHRSQTTRHSALMLKSSMKVYRSQRIYTRLNPQYRAAYFESRNFYQHHWGDRVIQDMVRARRAGNIEQALRHMGVLLRFYPAGLRDMILHKIARMLRKNRVN